MTPYEQWIDRFLDVRSALNIWKALEARGDPDAYRAIRAEGQRMKELLEQGREAGWRLPPWLS